MRSALRIGAGLGLALVILTCTERSVTGPKPPGIAALDFSAWATNAAGQPRIPVDSLEVTLRRHADGSVAFDQFYGFRADTLKADSAVVRLDVTLSQSTETFDIVVRAFGGGLDWYRFTGSVQLSANATARPLLAGVYVGPGANAVRVRMLPADTTAVGGTSFPLRATAYAADSSAIAGVPIGYRLSDSTRGSIVYPTPSSALFTASPTLRDSVWLVAETPTHLKDSTRVHLVPPAARLVLVSGDKQTSVLNAPLPAPLAVRVLDALNGGFKGDTVRWTVTAGAATLKNPFSVSDDSGLAVLAVTPTAIGPLAVQAAVAGLQGSPVSFGATAIAGTIKQVVISPKLDTIANRTTLQYTAVAKDTFGNVVTTTFGWTSTVPSIAGIDPTSGLATALAGDSTKIIVSAGGVADTARLYVRALRTIKVSPADTVITAVGDSVLLKAAPLDNFGAPVTSGVNVRWVSASPAIVGVNRLTGRGKITGPGNGVILARDSVANSDSLVQGSATLRVNQLTFAVATSPKVDSIAVGGGGQILSTALDSNGYAIPGKNFTWAARLSGTGAAIFTVSPTGVVSGSQLGSAYVVASLIEGTKTFADSSTIVVTAAPPKQIQWAFDSTSVGTGGNASIGLAVSAPPTTPLVVKITSTDSTIAKASPSTVTIGAGTSAASVTVYGVRAGRAVLTASDSSGQGYSSRQMTVGVVSTITFRETASPCCQQQYFYLNQHETHRAQVWLSDPAPAGGLGVTFVYGKGLTAVTPSPAVIPAGQLSADVTFQGLTPGTSGQPDSVVPSSGGYSGKFSYVYVAPDSLRLNLPYPSTGVVGVGQYFQPTVSFTYAMDHPLYVAATLGSPLGATQATDSVLAGSVSQYLTVRAKSAGVDTLTVSAPGWVAASAVLVFSTPHIGVSGSTSMVAGDPAHGYWSANPQDSLRYGHQVIDTVRAILVSRDTTVVAVDSGLVKVPPGNASATTYSALRAQPAAGGKSVWLVASAPGYTSDSFQVNVQQPTLTIALGYPYDGRVAVGTSFQNAGYLSIPYVRTDTFKVVMAHTKKSVVAGPDTVVILKGQTVGYFNTRGDTVNGTDTMSVAAAPGYVVSGSPVVLHVDSIHVRPYSYPSQLYTISPPQLVSAYAYDAVNSIARPLVAPLRVALSLSDTLLKLDSAAVTIPAGGSYSNNDTLRVVGQDTVGAYLRTSAGGSRADSAGPIKVLPTPLTINFGYPYSGYVGRGLKLQGNYVSIPSAAPNTVSVALQRYNALKDSLSAAAVLIPKGASASQQFDIIGLDSTATDSLTAAAPGFLRTRATVTPSPVHVVLSGFNPSHLTTEPSQTVAVYTEVRATGVNQVTAAPVTFSIQSTDSSVIRIDSANALVRGDSATSVVAAGASIGYFRVRYFGSGTARIRVAAAGFSPDSSVLITVTGPSLYLAYPTVTAGTGQIFQNEYVYVNNAVTTPLVVHLQRSDSAVPPAAQVFALSADSVIIPAGASSAPVFEITGQNRASAQLIARATGYTQATATVAINQPRLATNYTTLGLYVGAPATPVSVYTEDQTAATRIVASTLAVLDTSTATTVALPDSVTIPIAARTSSSSVGIKGLAKGSTAIIFSAPTYQSDTLQVSVDSATLTLNSPPNGLGPNQAAQMSVSIPFYAPVPVTVTLGSSNTAVLAVPATVTIPANSNTGYFNVTGVSQGLANVTATATGFYSATLVPVSVGQPKLALAFNASVAVGTKNPLTVNATDANDIHRNVTQPLTVTLVSSTPAHTAFDSSTITIPAGSYYAQTGVTFDTAGVYTISASAVGYSGASVPSTATGALVRMVTGNAFSPVNVTISAGQYVTWKNADAITHTTTENSATPVWNASLSPGQTFSQYFGTAGTFNYHCTIHGTVMSGTVTVQ